jgi:hemerythrin-like domain-containing protein
MLVCDYCDCRSHPEIAELSADHDRVAALLARLEQAVAAANDREAAVVAAAVHEILEPHAAREEDGVFYELGREVGRDYVARFEAEHALIHRLLAEASGPSWRSAAAELVVVLRDHMLREETDLFPAAHQLLSPAQWAAIRAEEPCAATVAPLREEHR